MNDSTPQEAGPQRSGSSPQPWAALFPGLLLFVVVLAAFLPALPNGFVGYDDPDYVTENDHVRAGLTWEGMKWAFRSTEAANWHPLTRLSHMLDCQLFGLVAWGHHLTSILLHSLNATLLFVVLRRMTGATWRSFAVALLFGLHPLRVESVAWIAERKDVLSTLFWLLALWAYAVYAQRSTIHSPCTTHHASRFTFHVSAPYLLSLIFFAFGLMSKPMVVTLPCVLLLLDYWPLARLPVRSPLSPVHNREAPSIADKSDKGHAARKSQIINRIWVEKLPFFLASAVFSMVTFAVQKQGGAVVASLSFTERLANALVSYCRYLGKLFWPVDLAIFYPGVEHWPAVTVAATAALLLVLSLGTIALRRAQPYLLVGWLWYLGTLVPVIGLVQVGMQSMADRYSYIPSIGILLALVWATHATAAGIMPAWTRWQHHALAAGAALAMAALACAALTWRQLSYWRDTETLFRHALRVTKDNYGAHHALGMALDRQHRLDDAIAEYRATIRARSNYVLAYNNLAVDLDQKGLTDEAIQALETAMRMEPTYADPYNNLGMILEKKGRYDEALELFRKAVRLNPKLPNPLYNLGNSLSRKGLFEEAAEAFRRVIALRPNDAEAHNNLGFMWEQQGRLAEATQEYLRATQLNPDYPRAHYNLGLALARQDHLPEAVTEFREALRLKPDYPAARTNLALALSLLQSAQGKPAGSRTP